MDRSTQRTAARAGATPVARLVGGAVGLLALVFPLAACGGEVASPDTTRPPTPLLPGHIHSAGGDDFPEYTNEPTGPTVLGEDGLWRTPLGLDVTEVSAYSRDAVPTPEQLQAAEQFVAEVRRLSARYTDPANAVADGYGLHPSFGADHWVHLEWLNDDVVLAPDKPEFVMYDPKTKEFTGVMFVMPWGQKGPQFAGPLSVWHYHTMESGCWDGQLPLTALTPGDPECLNLEVREGSPEMLHVWFTDTPDGPMSSFMAAPKPA